MLQLAPITQLTMALTKFSAATTTNGYRGPIPWTHIMNDSGLLAVFEFHTSQSQTISNSQSARFKVVNDPETLVMLLKMSNGKALILVGRHKPRCTRRCSPRSGIESRSFGHN